MRTHRGFTLIELMVVVGILGILMAIAIPAYNESVRKGQRAEALRAIGDIQMRQERYRADYPTYGNFTAASTAAGNLLGSVANVTAYNAGLLYYTLTLSNVTGTTYTITATRKGALATDPKCANFTMAYSAGTSTKGMSDSANVDYCWRQ